MRWTRAGLLSSLLVAMACGGKAGSHGKSASAAAGMGGSGVPVPDGGGGVPDRPAAGGATSVEPGGTGGVSSAGENMGPDEGGAGGSPAEPLPRFCDEQPQLFCADFDGAVYDEGWQAKDAQGGGSVAPFTNDAISAPRAMLSKILKMEFKGPASATVDVGFPAGAHGYWLSFDLFIDQVVLDPTSSQHVELKLVEVVNGASSTGLSLTHDTQGDRLWHAASFANSGYIWGGFFPRQQWFHVELAVTYGKLGTGTFDLKLNDAEPIHWMDTSVTDSPGPIQLKLGLRSNHASYDASALYDNVTFDLMP